MQDVERLRVEVGDIDAAVVARQRVALATAKACASLLVDIESEREGLLGVLNHVEQQCAAALLDSGFASTTEALAVTMSVEEFDAIERDISLWERRWVEVDIQLATLSEAGLGDHCPDTELLRIEADALIAELRSATNVLSQRDLRLNDAQGSVGLSRAVLKDSDELRADHATAERVATLCVGRNRINVALETWVLAGELERVTGAANVHLERMTRGRYRLERSGDADDRRRRGGLDLVVLDADTGKPRVPGTLSGGEQFQASLALALGLADVVSQGGSGSGKVFEALFVDEGFGSLDPQALDEAIDALHELHATGRMVGVITHVETMKQQLPIGIEVLVRPDGAGSTLRQP
jgi:exonuclease SbcC